MNGEYASHSRSLIGKVVLLIASDAASVQHLIMQLAARGADIALVSPEASVRMLRLLKEDVAKAGRRFLHIDAIFGNQSSAEHTVQRILSQFRHIDVFIDLSADQRQSLEGAGRLTTAAFLTDWALTEAALREIARLN